MRQVQQRRATRDFASSSSCEQMAMVPSQIDKRVLDLLLTNVSDVEGVRVDSPVGASDHSVVFYRCGAAATYSSLGV